MATHTLELPIQAGRLSLCLTENAHRLDELLAFASRLNPRRGYLFVSRVLGKHIPVRPSVMDAIHAQLADAVALKGNTAAYVVGMAETAVGLGAGVARHLSRHVAHSIFHHTTRFLVPDPWIRIRERHSHADTMHMARLNGDVVQALPEAQDLVLVDDEISTGLTLADLATNLLTQPELAHVRRLHIVSIVSWLTDETRRTLLENLPAHIDVRFVQLMAGTFSFTPAKDYQAVLPDDVDTDFSTALLDAEHPCAIEHDGLHGTFMRMDAHLTLPQPDINAHAPHVVYGMGEYLDAPFRLALQLEQQGVDILFQSSSRSPIALGDAIASRLKHPSPDDRHTSHYLYNAPLAATPLAFDGIGRPDLSQALEEAHHRAAARQEATP